MKRQHNNKQRRALSLMEVLIALGLSAALLASAFSFYFNLLAARQRLVERADQQRAADVVIDQIEANLTTSIVGDRTIGAGVLGSATTLTIAGRSVAANFAERGADDPTVFDDLQATELRFSEAGGTITIHRTSPLEEGAAHGDAQVLTDRIGKLRFRYFNGSTWRDTFDSLEESALPVAVEVAIWFDINADENAAFAGENWAGASNDSEESDRFGGGGFDEFAFAMREDRGFEKQRLPDRWRVIGVPDAAKDSVAGAVGNRSEDASGGVGE